MEQPTSREGSVETVSRISIGHFVKECKRHTANAISHQEKTTLVIGNESADLDSLSASLLFAYFRSHDPPLDPFTPVYSPVLGIPAADIALRPEFSSVLSCAGIDPQHLLTTDDLPPPAFRPLYQPPALTRFILVDHNRLPLPLEHYAPAVRGVIDHHEEENVVPHETEPEPRIIQHTGSCTSLIVQYFQPTWDALSDPRSPSIKSFSPISPSSPSIDGRDSFFGGSSTSWAALGIPSPLEAVHSPEAKRKSQPADDVLLWDAQVAKLALASILIDTRNYTDENKVTSLDKDMARYLEGKIFRYDPNWSSDTFYDEVFAAKLSFEQLDFQDVLRKDYKSWTDEKFILGISTVEKPLQFLVDKAISEESIDDKNVPRPQDARRLPYPGRDAGSHKSSPASNTVMDPSTAPSNDLGSSVRRSPPPGESGLRRSCASDVTEAFPDFEQATLPAPSHESHSNSNPTTPPLHNISTSPPETPESKNSTPFTNAAESVATGSDSTASSLARKEAILTDAFSAFTKSRELSIFAIMTAWTAPDGAFRKDLVLQCTADGRPAAERFIRDNQAELALQDEPIDGLSRRDDEGHGPTDGRELPRAMELADGGARWVWQQTDLRKSRKQVAPMIRDAIKAEGRRKEKGKMPAPAWDMERGE